MREVVALLVIAGFTVNCASIAHGTRQDISVQSTPSNADVVVKCAKDAAFNAPPTPAEITLKRNRGGCLITVSKDGYEPRTFRLTRQLSGWYIANILIGGVIGLIIDAADGAMFNLSPNNIVAVLPPRAAPIALEEPTFRKDEPRIAVPVQPAQPPAPPEPTPQPATVVQPGGGEVVPKQEPVEVLPTPIRPTKTTERVELKLEPTPPAKPSAGEVKPPASAPKKEEAQPVARVEVRTKETHTTATARGSRSTYPVYDVRNVKSAWRVLVTNDLRAVIGCKSLRKTTNQYDFHGSFPVRDVQEDAVRAGGNVVLTPTGSGSQPAVIFSCPVSQ